MNSPWDMVLSTDFLRTVPESPGVYLMKDSRDTVLYVGKAKELRKRLTSYRRTEAGGGSKTAALLARVGRIETILTSTEKEALILEASLIKKHRPRYNVILRDDKNYPLIKVTVQEKWPRLAMTRTRKEDGSRYFGPYSSPAAMWETLGYLHKLFPLRRCRGKLKPRQRPCLNHQMGHCLAPCAGLVERGPYLEMVEKVLLVLEGRNRELLRSMEGEMLRASEEQRYEEAALWRDRIRAFTHTLEKQVMVSVHGRDQDVFGFARQGQAVAVALLQVRQGAVSGHRGFYLAEPLGDDPEVLAEVLRRYYGEGHQPAAEVLLPFAVDGQEALGEWLEEQKAGGRPQTVKMLTPRRGERADLLRMAGDNAAKIHADREQAGRSWQRLSENIGKLLRLEQPPQRICCLDISNTGGELAVGSLVSFLHGEKEPAGYRHYRIKEVQGPDDYGMMAEVLGRFFAKAEEQRAFPDLLLLDGGKGQLNVALRVLADLGLEDGVELAGIAKERKEEGEKLYRPGRSNPIRAPRHNDALLFLMRVRDEAHRFGVTFHRKLRSKDTLRSRLDLIAGVGPVRRQKLLAHFGSVERLRQAEAGEIAKAGKLPEELARRILHELAAPSSDVGAMESTA